MSTLKEFNTYLVSIDSDFWKREILEHGIPKKYKKGEEFIAIGSVAKHIGWIKTGSVKYVAYTHRHDEKIVGLETAGGFAASWPFCLHGMPSVVSIVANTDLEIVCLPVYKIKEFVESNPDFERQVAQSTVQIFYTAYERLIDLYTKTPKERYEQLLLKCPKIFEIFDLKDIASYLNITPTHLSRLRKAD